MEESGEFWRQDMQLRGSLPVALLDLVLGCVRLDAQLVIELRFLDHGCVLR